MYYPLVGERVWLSGCRDEYVVEHADHTLFVAAIALLSDRRTKLERISFCLLFAHLEFEAAQAGVAARPAVEQVLRTSRLCLHQSSVFLREVRETTQATVDMIRKTQAMIAESDRNIARWSAFGYVRKNETSLA